MELTATQRRHRDELTARIAGLRDDPATPPRTLGRLLYQLQRRGWPAPRLVTLDDTLDTAAANLARADTPLLLIARAQDAAPLGRKAGLTRLPAGEHTIPVELADLAQRATSVRQHRTTGTGYALILTVDQVAVIIARPDRHTRIRQALQQRRAAGVRLGRPPEIPEPIRARIRAEHANGRPLTAIARGLNRDGIPTVHGKPWRHTTIRRIAHSDPPANVHPAPAENGDQGPESQAAGARGDAVSVRDPYRSGLARRESSRSG